MDLRYVGHTITDGKYALEGLPAFYGEGVAAQTLSVALRDPASGLVVELLYGCLLYTSCRWDASSHFSPFRGASSPTR